MRFAYIDSNGNEVPIPSVDALALRIELGAITDDTQLYDAAADQWAPADSHEIYHTLQRSAGGDEGFVAPPPVAPAPVGSEASDEPEVVEGVSEPREPVATEPEPELALEDDDSGGIAGLTLAAAPVEPEAEPESGALDPVLTLDEADVPSTGGGDLMLAPDDSFEGLDLAPTTPASEVEDGGDVGFDGIELAPPSADDGPHEPILDLAEDELLEDGETSGFDFGGLEGGLELEDASENEPEMDFPGGGLDTGAPDLGSSGDFGSGDGDPTPDFSGGMELETAMEFEAGGFDGGGGLDLEAPMSDFSPGDPPSWMEGEGQADDDVLDFSSVAPAGEEGAPASGERRTPKNRPSPPKHRKQRNLVLPLVGVVLLLAIGVGGYAAWPVLSERLAARGEPDTPAVVIPDLAPELMPQMQSAAGAAMAASFSAVVSDWSAGGQVDAPGTDWPGGAYMASASQYGVVEDFWAGMSDLLGDARGISLADFDAALGVELGAQGLSAADEAAIRERASAGFVAAAPARQATWDRFAAVVDASLALHQFVVANEAGIEYVPASTATTNPVLEIDAATPEISAALGDMLGAVIDGLSDLGYRDVVSSQGLRSHLLAELRSSGVQ